MPLEILDYDETWPQLFANEKSRITAQLGELALSVDHIGSTAVPGLAAKAIIDIQVLVARSEDLERAREPLVVQGYTYQVVPVPYFHRPQQWPHSYHVHVRVAGSREATNALVFRDWLRSQAQERAAYAALKRRLAKNSDADSAEGRARYSNAKTDYIREVLGRALRDAWN